MKIADSQSIKTGEKDMILSIMKKMDPQVLASIATQDLAPDSMEFVTGDMAIVDNRIVYRMNFKVTVGLAVMFDREGNLVQPDRGEAPAETVNAVGETADAGSDDEDIIELLESREPDEVGGDFEDLSGQGLSRDEAVQDGPASGDEDSMEAVLQRNKNFWSDRTAGVEPHVEPND